jgi:hypothetical protein
MEGETRPPVLLPLDSKHLDNAADRAAENRGPRLITLIHAEAPLLDKRKEVLLERST